jgi:hypothetical protein
MPPIALPGWDCHPLVFFTFQNCPSIPLTAPARSLYPDEKKSHPDGIILSLDIQAPSNISLGSVSIDFCLLIFLPRYSNTGAHHNDGSGNQQAIGQGTSMTLHQLKIFIVVATHLSVRAAAGELRIAYYAAVLHPGLLENWTD